MLDFFHFRGRPWILVRLGWRLVYPRYSTTAPPPFFFLFLALPGRHGSRFCHPEQVSRHGEPKC